MRVGVAALLDALVWRVEGRGPAAAREAHNRAQVDYYGRTEHPSMLPHSTSGYVDAQIAKALAAADVDDAARVLEIGAGMGRYTVRLAEMLGDRLEALELSPGMLADLAVAAPSMQAGHLHCADASDPPEVLLGRFDVVLGFFMLHHVHDLAAVLEGASRCLKPGGRVVFVEPNPLNVLYYVQMAVVPGMTFAGDRGIVRMRPRILAEAANEAGLMGFGYERFGFWPPFVRNTAFGAASERALERVPFLRPVLPFQLFFAEKPGPRSVAGSSTEDR